MKLGFIGFGNMAQALADGLVCSEALTVAHVGACARDFEKLKRNTESRGYAAFTDSLSLVEWADMVVVAVKPHQVEAVVAPLRHVLASKIVISVVAGWTFDRYETVLEAGTHHLSTLPNTPVSVCSGVVVCENQHTLSADEFRLFETLFSQVGLVISVDTPLLGIAGTICGCGPAFVCMFIEAMADAAVKHGVGRSDAYRMVSQMVAGTGRLQLETGAHPGVLKDAVCSAGGTTIVGVAELERKGLRGAVINAIDAVQAKKLS